MATISDRVSSLEEDRGIWKSSCKRHEVTKDHDIMISQGKDIENNSDDIEDNSDDIENIKISINEFVSTNTQTLTKINMSLDDLVDNQESMIQANVKRDANIQQVTTSTNLLAEKVTILFKKEETSNDLVRAVIKNIISALLIAGLLFLFSNAYKNMQNDNNNIKKQHEQLLKILPAGKQINGNK